MNTTSFDPTRAEFWTRRHAVYRELRDDHPVFHDTTRDVWVLSRFADVYGAVNDPVTFSSMAAEGDVLLPMLNYLDAPRHTELRRLVSRAFTPARVSSLESHIRAVAERQVETLLAAGGGDLIEQFSAPLAATVVGRLIGIPAEQLDDFRHLTDKFLLLGPSGGTAELQAIAGEIYALFADVVARRRMQPANDLITALIDVQAGGGDLSDEELLGFCFLLVGGGNDTTTNLIANGWVILLDHPAERERPANDRSLLGEAIEEMLRLQPPAESHMRQTTAPVELHGTVIPARARVQLLWGAANLDEREFDQPETFVLSRRPNRHLAFGHGAHFCLGASLARLEARIAFETLLDRCSGMQLARRPGRVLSPWACAYQHVDLTTEGANA